jgi:hypothetical protein
MTRMTSAVMLSTGKCLWHGLAHQAALLRGGKRMIVYEIR